ncbi:hypothetical protein BD769DRAFT_1393002 [Suillus cothurnatus]|nr:hypothetical protein BD769DRAFT_1393002 [Suillus cothurnatus]
MTKPSRKAMPQSSTSWEQPPADPVWAALNNSEMMELSSDFQLISVPALLLPRVHIAEYHHSFYLLVSTHAVSLKIQNDLTQEVQYLDGGRCAALIKSLGSLPEEWMKQYIAEVVVRLECLHQCGVVHRINVHFINSVISSTSKYTSFDTWEQQQ